MICPSCGQEPLSRSRFIWKPQAMTLECGSCKARLKMSDATQRTALSLILLLIAVFGAAGAGTMAAFFHNQLWTFPKAGMIALALVLAIVGGAYWVRTRLWSCTYVKK